MNNPKYRRFVSDFIKLLLLVVFGTVGFMLVERWSFLDSLYMTVITLTTVGYGEVHPLDTNGKIYAVVLILIGAGVVLYILSDMVELLIDINLGRRMKYRIIKLRDHQIVCGFGRTGQEVAEHFRENRIPFVVVEQDPQVVREAEDMGMLVLEGDASTDEVLLDAQISKARGIVCALPDDTQNTFIALTAKGLNETIDIVSRAANPGSEAKLRRAGARMVISPYVICGQRLAAAVTHPLVTEFLDVVMHTPGKDLRMEQFPLHPPSRLIGMTLRSANIKQRSGVMILAVKQNGKLITNPVPDLVFGAGDELIALGAQQELEKLAELVGRKES
ncbi:MAG: potassium channel protein [Candidatus Melainabacteria bacterium]|nr:potassium channel protein [Candidatus Melainabacteria bacterium]